MRISTANYIITRKSYNGYDWKILPCNGAINDHADEIDYLELLQIVVGVQGA
jgi:hypothetical protein